ncbi:PE-PGRS family protein [Streptomyces sp. NPDC018031]|uniref:PE-PGRS family protein n=1 Tax=Streptomyces sp. NPDC018031 TaxID=3365033 RepID=UPI0037979AB0
MIEVKCRSVKGRTMGDDRRQISPNDVEQLAKLLDGKGGLGDGLDEAFKRATTLGVTDQLSALKPLRAWVTTTAPDLRKRAAIARLDDGDPMAGLLWAGFTPEELKNYKGTVPSGEVLILANSVAASDDPAAYEFHRRPEESFDEWVKRLSGHALTRLPGLEVHEETAIKVIEGVAAWGGVTAGAAVGFGSGGAAVVTWLKNSAKAGRLAGPATTWAASSNPALRSIGGWLKGGPIRSLSAPGTWMATQLGTRLTGAPMLPWQAGAAINSSWDAVRASSVANGRTLFGITPMGYAQAFVGSDDLARIYGGVTHSGQVPRAAQASLWTVYKNASGLQKSANAVLPAGEAASSPFLKGLSTAGKTAGVWRAGGMGLSAFGAAYGTVDLVSQGNPVTAFKKDKAGYTADVAGTAFNYAMTAALINPNPVFVGAAAVTGLVYAGATIVDNWEGIKSGAKKVGGYLKDKGEAVVKKIDPRNWW